MQIKLSKAEMQALEAFLSEFIDAIDAVSLEEKLTMALLIKLYQKLAKALVVLQKNYSFKIDDATAIAFCIMFLIWPLTTNYFTANDFADNLVMKLRNQLLQHYA